MHTHVRSTAFVRSSRRRVQGIIAARPHRGQRSARAPGGTLDGNHGTFAPIRAIIHLPEVRLRGRNPLLGEAWEGAVEAPSHATMAPCGASG